MPEHSPSQTFIVDRLRIVGERLRRAREVLDEETDTAKATAVAAADAGLPETLIARELGVDRARTLRKWLGKM